MVVSLLFLICLFTFNKIRVDVLIDRDTNFDVMIFTWVDQFTTPEMTRFMRMVTFFGSSEYFMVVPPLLAIVFFFYSSMRWHAFRVLVITTSTSLLHMILKLNFQRVRPPQALLVYSGYGFPSGHAMISGAFYGLLIYLVWVTGTGRKWRWFFTCFFTLLVLVIGLSRIYLKVHYATDVVAGFAVGLLWLLLAIYILKKMEKLYQKATNGK